jgi:hypothetical protein
MSCVSAERPDPPEARETLSLWFRTAPVPSLGTPWRIGGIEPACSRSAIRVSPWTRTGDGSRDPNPNAEKVNEQATRSPAADCVLWR